MCIRDRAAASRERTNSRRLSSSAVEPSTPREHGQALVSQPAYSGLCRQKETALMWPRACCGTPQSRANTARNNSPSAQMGRVSTDGSRKRKATKHSTTALVTYPEAKKRTNSSKKPCNKDNKRPCRTKAKFTGRYSSAAASSLSARVGDRGATPPAGASHLMPTMGIVR